MMMWGCVASLLEATWQLMTAKEDTLTRRTYNITAMSFSPRQLVTTIQSLVPGFQCTYTPDFRDDIASTWPNSLDDSRARLDWGWKHRWVQVDASTHYTHLHTAPVPWLNNDNKIIYRYIIH